MRSPEERILQDLTLDQAYKKAERILKNGEIQLDDFADLYGEENVARDKEEVARLEREFEKSATPDQERTLHLSRTFEAIFHIHAELSEWLGPNAATLKASKFDDIKNGIDSIAEFVEEDRSAMHLALAIDVTFSQDLANKFNRIKKEIDNGELPKVKYFTSETLNFRGELSNVPRVVIGADARTVQKLAELWLEKDMDALGKDAVQFQILEEIVHELEAFGRYAERIGKPELVETYARTAALVRGILAAKNKGLEDSGERDRVFEAIHDELRSF